MSGRPLRITWYRLGDDLIAPGAPRKLWIGSLGIGDDDTTWMHWNSLSPGERFRAAMEGWDILGPYGRYVEILVALEHFANDDKERRILGGLDEWVRETHAMRVTE